MVSEEFTIINEQGLHARPANLFARECMKYQCDVTLEKDGKTINGKSILQILTGGISCGSHIKLICDGPDEDEALGAIFSLLKTGLE